MYDIWFIALNWAWPWILVGLVVAALAWNFISSTVGRCLAGLVLVLGIDLNMWPWVNLIFWIAFFVGVVAALCYNYLEHPRLSRHENGLALTARICGYVALGIPVVTLVIIVVRHIVNHGFDLHLSGWVWLAVLVVLVALALVVLFTELLASWVGVVAAVLAVVVFFGGFAAWMSNDNSSTNPTAGSSNSSTVTPAPSATVTVTAAPGKDVKVDVAKQVLEQAGHKANDVRFTHIKHNTARPGSDIFSKQLNTSKEVTDFLKSGTPQAKGVLASAMSQTGATKAQLEDPNNWIAAQFKKAIDWGGNTYWAGGGVKNASSVKTDGAGSIAVMFIPPDQVAAGKVTSVFVVRGACTNPQTKLPTPHQPTPTPTHNVVPTPPKPTPTPKPTHKPTPKPTCLSVYGPGHSGVYPNCHKDSTTAPKPPKGGSNGVPKDAPQGPNPSNVPDPNDTYTAPGGTGNGGSSMCKDRSTGYATSCDAPGSYDPGAGGFLD